MGSIEKIQTMKDARFEICSQACLLDARTIRDVLAVHGRRSLRVAHPDYLSAAFESIESEYSPWGSQYPAYDKPHEFGLRVRLMDPDNDWAEPPSYFDEEQLARCKLGVFYTVQYLDEAEPHEKLRFSINPDDGTYYTCASSYDFTSSAFKPEVDLDDLLYIRVLLKDAAEDSGIKLPKGGMPVAAVPPVSNLV